MNIDYVLDIFLDDKISKIIAILSYYGNIIIILSIIIIIINYSHVTNYVM